jgi:hypothetical protein
VNKRLPFLILSIAISFCATAQKIDGIWKGMMRQQAGGCFPVYYTELDIKIEGEKVTGVSYHYSDVTNYVKKVFTGTYYPATKSITINEGDITTFHIPPDCIPCVKKYSLSYRNEGKVERLIGDWTGTVYKTTSACQPGSIVLERVPESDFAHIKEVFVDTGMLRLDFYDNGIVDGDSISVTANNNVVVSHQLLSVKPITVYVKIDLEHLEQEITMIADNLGTIPPNTALLIVTSGKNRYKLYLESTDKKSAQVRFIYEKPK